MILCTQSVHVVNISLSLFVVSCNKHDRIVENYLSFRHSRWLNWWKINLIDGLKIYRVPKSDIMFKCELWTPKMIQVLFSVSKFSYIALIWIYFRQIHSPKCFDTRYIAPYYKNLIILSTRFLLWLGRLSCWFIDWYRNTVTQEAIYWLKNLDLRIWKMEFIQLI